MACVPHLVGQEALHHHHRRRGFRGGVYQRLVDESAHQQRQRAPRRHLVVVYLAGGPRGLEEARPVACPGRHQEVSHSTVE